MLFHETQYWPPVMWRGRWRNPRTLSAYIQEAGAGGALAVFATHDLDRVEILATATQAAVNWETEWLRSTCRPLPYAPDAAIAR